MALGALRPGLVYCPGDWVPQLASMNDFHFSQQRLSGGPAIQPPDGQRGPIESMCELAKGNRYRRPYSAFLPIGLSVPMIPRPHIAPKMWNTNFPPGVSVLHGYTRLSQRESSQNSMLLCE